MSARVRESWRPVRPNANNSTSLVRDAAAACRSGVQAPGRGPPGGPAGVAPGYAATAPMITRVCVAAPLPPEGHAAHHPAPAGRTAHRRDGTRPIPAAQGGGALDQALPTIFGAWPPATTSAARATAPGGSSRSLSSGPRSKLCIHTPGFGSRHLRSATPRPYSLSCSCSPYPRQSGRTRRGPGSAQGRLTFKPGFGPARQAARRTLRRSSAGSPT